LSFRGFGALNATKNKTRKPQPSEMDSKGIRAGDPILLYNATHQMYLKDPVTFLTPSGSLGTYAALSKKPSEAGLFLFARPNLVAQQIPVGDPFLIRSVEGGLQNKIYLGALGHNSFEIQYQQGQQVGFLEPLNLKQVEFVVSKSTESKFLEYGRLYILKNVYSDEALQKSETGPDTVFLSHGYDHIDQWIFVPAQFLFTCQKSVNLCVETSGKQNAFEGLLCQSGTCLNFSKDRVFFSQEQCNQECGI